MHLYVRGVGFATWAALVEQKLLTLPDQLRSSRRFTCPNGVHVVHIVKVHVFTFLVRVCPGDFRFDSLYSHLVCSGFCFICVIYLRLLV
jgi:hypothetical protein